MIFDHFSRLSVYRTLSPTFATAVDYLTSTDVTALPLGRYEVDGDRVFAMVQSYTTKPADQARWETHRRFLDIQLMLVGSERMDVAGVETVGEPTEYDPVKDATFYARHGEYLSLIVRPATFAIFFPHDAHRPTITTETLDVIRKVVVKVAC